MAATGAGCSADADIETDAPDGAAPDTAASVVETPAPIDSPAVADTPSRPAAAKPGDTNAPPNPGAPPTGPRPVVGAEEQAQIDVWLTAYADSLNDYGDPEGTMYAGGTPLFNETKGEMVSKYEYIVAKHPEKPWTKPMPAKKSK